MVQEFNRGERVPGDGARRIESTPTPVLFREFSRQAQRLLREEVRLARRELSNEMKDAARSAALTGVGGALLYGGVLALIACVGFALALVAPLWVAFLITGVGFVLIGALISIGGAQRLKQFSLKPEQTTETFKEDSRWASETMRAVRSRTRANA